MPNHKPDILVVDDEPAVHFLVEELLDREQVHGVADAAALDTVLGTAFGTAFGTALGTAFGTARPDLVLLDIGLPDVDGFELAATRLSAPGMPPFIFLTALDDPRDIARGLSLGALDYIRKPFNAIEFVARVRAALTRIAAGQHLPSGAGYAESRSDAAGGRRPPGQGEQRPRPDAASYAELRPDAAGYAESRSDAAGEVELRPDAAGNAELRPDAAGNAAGNAELRPDAAGYAELRSDAAGGRRPPGQGDQPPQRGVAMPQPSAMEQPAGADLLPPLAPERRSGIYGDIVGSSPALVQALALLDRAAGIDATVLLQGESGTGKELFARAFHKASGRADGPFVPVNCAAVPRELAESLFFGHARGAFTGAQSDRPGWFDEARGGTLFLDEIGELPGELQGALLRVVENRRIRRIGEQGERGIDVRLIAATNRDLRAMVAAGRFRADLFYRIDEIPVTIPALRDRPGDIAELAARFLAEFSHLSPVGPLFFSAGALAALVQHGWPGNVRELRNMVRRLALMARSPLIDRLDSLPSALWSLPSPAPEAATSSIGQAGTGADYQPEPTSLANPSQSAGMAGQPQRPADAARDSVAKAWQTTGGNAQQAAALLGISRATLYRRLRLYELL
jgi:DNA-binding NtrC family response regulator